MDNKAGHILNVRRKKVKWKVGEIKTRVSGHENEDTLGVRVADQKAQTKRRRRAEEIDSGEGASVALVAVVPSRIPITNEHARRKKLKIDREKQW